MWQILTRMTILRTFLSVDDVQVVGELNSSQDGVVVTGGGCSPCLTAGHGNCTKVMKTYETQ